MAWVFSDIITRCDFSIIWITLTTYQRANVNNYSNVFASITFIIGKIRTSDYHGANKQKVPKRMLSALSWPTYKYIYSCPIERFINNNAVFLYGTIIYLIFYLHRRYQRILSNIVIIYINVISFTDIMPLRESPFESGFNQ